MSTYQKLVPPCISVYLRPCLLWELYLGYGQAVDKFTGVETVLKEHRLSDHSVNKIPAGRQSIWKRTERKERERGRGMHVWLLWKTDREKKRLKFRQMFIRILTKAGERLYEKTSKWSQNYPPDSCDIWMGEIDCDPCQCRVQRWGHSLSVPCAKREEHHLLVSWATPVHHLPVPCAKRKHPLPVCDTRGLFTSVTCNTLASAGCSNTNASLASVADNNTRHLSVHNRDARVTRHAPSSSVSPTPSLLPPQPSPNPPRPAFPFLRQRMRVAEARDH